MYQEHLRANGAVATLMSGSGSTTFALAASRPDADRLAASFREKFGPSAWLETVAL
ncbi:MAG TPA: hypothetical protein VHH73_06355 [Verrucomicrobiae bacterium]|nr:hypothetical protein [Verrucomicrobiae bacterium]